MDIHLAVQKVEERFDYEGNELSTEAQYKICPVCHGTKQVEGPVDTLLECSFCNGTGKLRTVR